jgi:S1-C subfamily serine protease
VIAVGAGLGAVAVTRSSAQPDSALSRPQWSASGIAGSADSGSADPGSDNSGSASSGSDGSGWGGFSGGWRGGLGHNGTSAGGGAQTAITEATDTQQAGVVDIDVVLGGTERAAGTGMVLTASGEVLTNKHVVQGETNISVTVAATGKTYAARVVGISTTTDVAVVQLINASGLATVRTASGSVQLGDPVVGVGNAGGTGGRPSAAAGKVTGLEQNITASDSNGSNPERLTGLIETDAPIQAGDSGGPLLDASNAVVGMDSAGSSQGNDGYAIPIGTALSVAHQIETGGSGTQAGAGTSTSTAQRAYLGVVVHDGADGVQVTTVVQGSPAAEAGLEAGDTITSVAGHRVGSVEDLSTVMASLSPGRRVIVTWVDQDGAAHSARVTPVAGQ